MRVGMGVEEAAMSGKLSSTSGVFGAGVIPACSPCTLRYLALEQWYTSARLRHEGFEVMPMNRPNVSRFAAIKLLLLVAAFLSFLLSVGLFFLAEERAQGIFVGLWVPSILSLGALMLVGEDKR